MATRTTYGLGGYDPNLPNNNVVSVETIPDDPFITNADTLKAQAEQALQNNRDFLANAAPSNAQVLSQVRALTRQMNGAMRLLLGKLDGTD